MDIFVGIQFGFLANPLIAMIYSLYIFLTLPFFILCILLHFYHAFVLTVMIILASKDFMCFESWLNEPLEKIIKFYNLT